MIENLKTRTINWLLRTSTVTIDELYDNQRFSRSPRVINDFSDNPKFISDTKLKDIFVHTPTGYEKVNRLLETIPYDIYILELDNGRFLRCADTHIVIDQYGNEVYVKDLTMDVILRTDIGLSKVNQITVLPTQDNMFDLELDSEGHVYYTNGILSHNTTVIAAYLLWYAVFEFDKNVLVASNLNENAMDIMDRIIYAYENLPMWLKPGCKYSTMHMLDFDNGCSIRSSTTTAKTGRGKAIALLMLDELAHVDRRIQEAMWVSLAPTLSCVTGDTLVLTDNGYKKIEDFHIDKKIGDYFPLDCINIWGKNGLETVSHGYVSPESETLKIRTRHGLELEVTNKHPLFTMDKNAGVMVQAKDLKIGDYLRVDVGMNIFGSICPPNDIAYMLGGYIAEGWMGFHNVKSKRKYYSVYISNMDAEFRDVYLNNEVIKPFKPINQNNKYKIICQSKEMVNYFESFGINPILKCHNKEIPSMVFGFSKKHMAAFLAGLLDGDGSVTDRSINLTSTSKKLINQVQILFLNFGIVSTIFKIKREKILEREKKSGRLLPHGKPIQDLKDCWSLNIPLSQYEKFNSIIPIKIGRKKQKILEIISKRKQDDFKHYTIPVDIIKEKICVIVKESNRTQEFFRKNGVRLDKLLDKNNDRKMTQHLLSKFIDIIDKNAFITSENRLFLKNLQGKFFWDDIVSIEKSINKTYDFTVPDTHTFLQNGILGSNTGGACIVSSTPNGDDDLFADLWTKGTFSDPNDPDYDDLFTVLNVEWDEHPDRTEAFRRMMIDKIGDIKWSQEFSCDFLSSESMLVNSKILSNLKSEQPIFIDHGVRFWDVPKCGKTYLIGADPNTGVELDFGAIEVFEFPSMKQIAEFRNNKIDSTKFYGMIKWIIRYFLTNAQVVGDNRDKPDVYWTFENNGIGEGIIALLYNDENFPEDAMLLEDGGKRRGITTTGKSKVFTCHELKRMIEHKKEYISIKSDTLISELKNYIQKSTGKEASYKARYGATDDLISATLLVVQLFKKLADQDPEAFNKAYNIAESDDVSDVGIEEGDGDDAPSFII